MQIIAEVKTHSPYGWKSDKSWDELFNIANRTGDIISVHTDKCWHGSFELLAKARALTKKPILAKGIHSKDADIEKALEAGADYVLVVGRLPESNIESCFIEPNSLDELRLLPENLKIVWNSRDLETGALKEETFQQARIIFKGWLCQASNIKSFKDVDPSADAILVGTNLPKFASESL
jgi:indole-3-glycerol phosphate synthase